MAQDPHNPLVGRCPICSDPESSSDHSDAYVGSTIVDSDKDVPLEWSVYYQLYVCRLCNIKGQDLQVDEVRDDDEVPKDQSRQKMGFGLTYTKNSID